MVNPWLENYFSLIDREAFVAGLGSRGYGLTSQRTRTVPQGKAFWRGLFRRQSDRNARQV